ncbi:MAG: ECF transporter S component [Clostridia bacterium]|nr:ECF transporter S component [Clostridia bacterium]
MKNDVKRNTLWLCITAMFMGLNVVMSSFGIPVPGGHFYLNDVVICTASILLDPLGAFIVGGIGAFLGDFFFYPTPMFVSLVTHGLQAVVISTLTRQLFKSRPAAGAVIGVIIGAFIMVIGYSFGRAFIYSTPEYAIIKLPYQVLQAVIGAAGGIILCYCFRLKKIFDDMFKKRINA